MKAGLVQWVVCLGLVGAPWAARTGVAAPCQVTSPPASVLSFTKDPWKLRPIKKRVGRAVTPTMDKIDNVWFVLSQIVIPLSAIIFSVVYVRRYRAKQATDSANPATPDAEETREQEQPSSGEVRNR